MKKLDFQTRQSIELAILDGKPNQIIQERFWVSLSTINRIKKDLFDTPEGYHTGLPGDYRPCPNCQFAHYSDGVLGNGCRAYDCDFIPKFDRKLKLLLVKYIPDNGSWRYDIRKPQEDCI